MEDLSEQQTATQPLEPSHAEEPPLPATWGDFGLKENLMRGIYAYGYEAPSPIQQRAILPFISGRDMIAQAQSGTGKTGSFSVATLQLIDEKLNEIQAIILEPTRELARQTHKVVSSLATEMGAKSVCLVGGTSVNDDYHYVKTERPQIVIGTAGRVYDILRRIRRTDRIRVLVLDEADNMLSHGFEEQVRSIFRLLPRNVQMVLYSATMPPEIVELSERFMRDPVHLMMEKEKLNLECIQQYYAVVYNDRDKYDLLKCIYDKKMVGQSIVYANSVRRVEDLYYMMSKDGFAVGYIHGSMTKEEREEQFQKFRVGEYRILISSDITARGIDVQQVNLVINYDLTANTETYLHRIGRGGRWGRQGEAINFITKKDVNIIRRIESHYKSNIVELKL